MNNTVNYYNEHALEYFNDTFSFDNSFNQWKFMNEVFAGSYEGLKMLDVGCGSCRDTVFFKNRGMDVLPIDASKELAAIIKEKLGIDVCVMDMTEISFIEEFDFIWASASVMHFDKMTTKGILSKCYQALKPGGLFYVSVKMKEDIEVSDGERYFAYYSKEEFLQMLKSVGLIEKVFWYTKDTLGRSTTWLNFIVTK